MSILRPFGVRKTSGKQTRDLHMPIFEGISVILTLNDLLKGAE